MLKTDIPLIFAASASIGNAFSCDVDAKPLSASQFKITGVTFLTFGDAWPFTFPDFNEAT